MIPQLLLLAVPAVAQHPNVARGVGTNQAYQVASNMETIDTFNGGLALRIPVSQLYPVGGGLSYSLMLTYSSKLWEYEPVGNTPHTKPSDTWNAGFGWRLSLGQLYSPEDKNNPSRGSWLYEAADGARLILFNDLRDPLAGMGEFFYDPGTPLRLDASGAAPRLEFPDGTVHTFDGQGRPTRIEDRSGNYLAIAYFASYWQLSDRHGRLHKVFFTSAPYYGPNSVVSSVELESYNGGTSRYLFEYASQTVDAGCPNQHTPNSYQLPFLQKLTLPDNSYYEMPVASSYELPLGSPTCSASSGLLKGITLPTGGRFEYGWGTYAFPLPEGERCTEFLTNTPGIRERRRMQKDLNGNFVLEGRWTYTPKLEFSILQNCFGATGSTPPRTMTQTVVDPLGHSTVTHFSVAFENVSPFKDWMYGLPIDPTQPYSANDDRYLSTEVKANGTVLKRATYLSYEQLPSGATLATSSLRRVNRRRVRYHDDGGYYSDLDSSQWDGFGHYRIQLASGSPGFGSARTSVTQFNPTKGPSSSWSTSDPWVLNTFTEQTQSQDGVTAKQSYCFDTATGLLERTRIHKSGTALNASDLIEAYGYGQGNPTVESYYGGDVQALSTSANLCGLALPAPQYQVVNTYQYGSLATSEYPGSFFKAVDRSIDRSTGLATSERDSSGLETSFSYDKLGRQTQVSPPGEAPITTSYAIGDGASVTTTRGSFTSSINYFDGFGRFVLEDTRVPAASGVGTVTARRHTDYDAVGNIWRTSEVNIAGQGTTWTSGYGFDPFGRPASIVAPDGKVTSFSYQGVRQLERTVQIGTGHTANGNLIETASTTRQIYDHLGRLTRVRSPTLPGGAWDTTDYRYDVGGRLDTVIQGQQSRHFSYDQRGFLLSEQHPELGISGDGTTTYLKYDARGNPQRRIDGSHDLTFEYDSAERLRKVRETGGSQRELKRFVYANVNSGLDKRQGKLIEATRTNWVVAPWAPQLGEIGVEVIQQYQYANGSGRPSTVTTETNLANMPSFAVGYGYDSLGNVSSLAYPRCANATGYCSDNPGPGRTVTMTYFQGSLRSIPGYLNLITYHPNGMLHEVHHNTSPTAIVDTYDNDPQYMRRPRRIYNTIYNELNPNPEEQTNGLGPYEYDGAGNITQVGCGLNFYCRRYHYDKASRLVEDTSANSASVDAQRYTFDRYGNITQTVTTRAGAATTRTFSVNPGTNHLTAATYDASGNQTSWGSFQYRFDPFQRLATLTGGGNSLTHLYTADDERFWSLRWDPVNLPTGELSIFRLRGLDGKVLTEYQSTGNSSSADWTLVKDYIYRGGLLLAAAEPSGKRQHFTLDHLGTARAITNRAGTYLSDHHYFGFGEEIGAPGGEVMKFTGHERDLLLNPGPGDDLDYMHARYYSPNQGRFLSVDTFPATLDVPAGWNRYGYVNGRSMNQTDPLGLFGVGAFNNARSVGESFYWFIYGAQDSITVTGSAWAFAPGSSTGLQGLQDLIAGSLLYQSILDLSYVDSSDFDLGRTAEISGQGLAAFADGVIPFGDPFENQLDVYDPEDLGLGISRAIGGLTRDAAITVSTSGSATLFGKGAWLNRGQRLRVGHSVKWSAGKTYFSVRGEFIERFIKSGHLDLWIIRNIVR
jgi:RHS repeat-associated protein